MTRHILDIFSNDNTMDSRDPNRRSDTDSCTTGSAETGLIWLHVGGDRQFETLRTTLTDGIKTRMSAGHFIDCDPVLFEHILRYLRTRRFPLFFDAKTQTFDYVLYDSLLGAARYFSIRELAEWIEKEAYLDAVQTTRTVTTIEDIGSSDDLQHHLNQLNSRGANCKVEISISSGTKKVYVCPRGIFVHRGDPSRCGQACKKMRERGDAGLDFEDEPVASAVVIATEVKVKYDRDYSEYIRDGGPGAEI
ncbi:hypothetical protein F4818DRAFT_33834 [Hypoxylon cercidicola]|nr:hypothetical protein F4818DRAFT_33834 [Hypoxylon cercidicola]